MSELPTVIKWLSLPTLVTTLAIVLAFHQAINRNCFGYATIFFFGLLTAGQLV